MAFIRAYTREIVDRRTYPSALAHSVHFAISLDGKDYSPLNNNYGILFTKAEIGEQNQILERGAANPKIYFDGCEYYVFADFVDPENNEVYPDLCWLWKTCDFINICEVGYVKKSDYENMIGNACDVAVITTANLEKIVNTYSPIHFIKANVQKNVTVSSICELDSIKAECIYSDGSSDIKPIKWDLDNLPESGTFEVSGEIIQPVYPAPCIRGFADPIVRKWEGKWYYIATNDNTGDVGLYASGADTVEGLFAKGNEPKCILPYDESRNFIQTFWAPEFHVIGGDLYILFAVGAKQWSPQSHMMRLKKGGDILNPDDWENPIRVKKADGTNLVEGQITLDMTYFEANGRHYIAWSQRTFNPVDSGSMIYIGEIDPAKPYQLISEPTLIARPLYGWENQSGTVNNEGPYPLIVGDKIYLAFTGGAAGGFSYTMGYLIADISSDLLDAKSWHKTITPVLSSYNMNVCEGPGHNGFYVGDDGKVMITYHGQLVGEDHRRNTYIHRVHFNKDGYPVLNVTPERDLPEDKKAVKITVTLK